EIWDRLKNSQGALESLKFPYFVQNPKPQTTFSRLQGRQFSLFPPGNRKLVSHGIRPATPITIPTPNFKSGLEMDRCNHDRKMSSSRSWILFHFCRFCLPCRREHSIRPSSASTR